jgi:hypothetical protein
MSLAPKDQAEQNRLEKFSKSFFRSQAWEVEELTKGTGHFITKKDQIRLFVSCHDSQGRKFFPSYAIMDAMVKKAYDIKVSRNIPTAFVFSSHLPDVVPDIVAQRGLYLFASGELTSITELGRFSTELPSDQSLTERQKGVLRQQLSLCLSIVERFHTTGDLSAAIAWARYAVDGADRYTKAHDTLFSLLLEAGDLPAAADLGNKVLKKNPDSLFFLRGMQKLSPKQGPDQDEEDWEVRIAQAKKRTSALVPRQESLEAILQRQAPAIPSKERASASSAPNTENGRGIARLIRRIVTGSS